MLVKRSGSAAWNGSGKNGKGQLSTQSKTLNNTNYSFMSRFEEGNGTNPEELIAAAHAGCYTMALSFLLARDGIPSEKIETQATVAIELVGDGFEITTIVLKVSGKVPGIDEAKFKEYAEMAKTGCAVSKLVKAAISLESHFVTT